MLARHRQTTAAAGTKTAQVIACHYDLHKSWRQPEAQPRGERGQSPEQGRRQAGDYLVGPQQSLLECTGVEACYPALCRFREQADKRSPLLAPDDHCGGDALPLSPVRDGDYGCHRLRECKEEETPSPSAEQVRLAEWPQHIQAGLREHCTQGRVQPIGRGDEKLGAIATTREKCWMPERSRWFSRRAYHEELARSARLPQGRAIQFQETMAGAENSCGQNVALSLAHVSHRLWPGAVRALAGWERASHLSHPCAHRAGSKLNVRRLMKSPPS